MDVIEIAGHRFSELDVIEIAGHRFSELEVKSETTFSRIMQKDRSREYPHGIRCLKCDHLVPLMLSSRTLGERGTPCTYKPGPKTFPFVCKSGRVALANDLRQYFPDEPNISLNTAAGRVRYAAWYAKRGYLTNIVGNTGVYFLDKPVIPEEQSDLTSGLDIVIAGSKSYSDNDSDSEEFHEMLERESVASISAELWWFAIVDAADLPPDATDSYDRKITHYDLPKGKYLFTISDPADDPQFLWDLGRGSYLGIRGKLRRVEDNP